MAHREIRYLEPFTLKEYYLWKRGIESKYPWNRQNPNYEFLEYEKKRLTELGNWHKNFIKTDENQALEEVSFYTVPVKLSSLWRGAIANLGDFNYIGLSALYNSPQVLLLALLPNDKKPPKEYRLIRIVKSKRINIVNERLYNVQPSILIEKWDYLPSDMIYRDIPYEKKIVEKVIRENLIHDKQVSLSFQSPIISTPYEKGSVGGISLSSLLANSEFAKELIKTIQTMVPPEYRGFNPPKGAYKGSDFQYTRGISFHLAERPYFDNNILSGVYDTSYRGVQEELDLRNKFTGEYSIFSAINPDAGNYRQMLKELLKNFTSTEITLPQNIDEMPEADVDLTRLKNVTNEDLWIQIVHSRQINPAIQNDNELINTVKLLRDDYDAILSDSHKQDVDRDYIVRGLIPRSKDNLTRIARSLARSEDKSIVSPIHMKRARNLIIDNLKGFVSSPEFTRIESKIKKKRIDARFSVVQTCIINNPHLSTREIYDDVKPTGLFMDIYDLQKLLDCMEEEGHVIIDINKKYVWIGK